VGRTHLLLGDGVVLQHEVRQPQERAKRIKVRQLLQVVRLELQVGKQRDRVYEGRLNRADTVACQQEGAYPGAQGEVPQNLDVVVDKVDGILRLMSRGRGRPIVSQSSLPSAS
jgi:hypothetical protein